METTVSPKETSGAVGQFWGVAFEQKSLQHFLVINFMKMFPISRE